MINNYNNRSLLLSSHKLLSLKILIRFGNGVSPFFFFVKTLTQVFIIIFVVLFLFFYDFSLYLCGILLSRDSRFVFFLIGVLFLFLMWVKISTWRMFVPRLMTSNVLLWGRRPPDKRHLQASYACSVLGMRDVPQTNITHIPYLLER